MPPSHPPHTDRWLSGYLQRMPTLPRTEAAKEILERSFRFETKLLYAVTDGDETQLYFPESVLSTVELRDQFIDSQTGELRPPNQLCILVPDESDLEIDLPTYLTEDRGISRDSALENPAVEDSPSIIQTESWRPAPDVFSNEAVQNWLIEHYKITIQQEGGGYRVVSRGGDVGTGRAAGEAVVACVLEIKGLEDVRIAADKS